MARMVLLEHTLPDGTRHYDWLIEPVGAGPGSAVAVALEKSATDPEARSLLAFRVIDRIDHPKTATFVADMLPLHRRKYLDYQGDIEGKGRVRRVCGGMVRKVEVMGHEHDGVMDAISIRGKFTGPAAALTGGAGGGGGGGGGGAGVGGTEYTWAGVREGDLWRFMRSRPSLVQNRSRLEEIDRNPLTMNLDDVY